MDAIGSTIGNMAVSQIADASAAKPSVTSALFGVGGDVDDMVLQAAQTSYGRSSGDQFESAANWNLAMQSQSATGGASSAARSASVYAGAVNAYGGSLSSVEQARAQRIAELQVQAGNPADVRPGWDLPNVLVIQDPSGYGEMRDVPWNLRDALSDPWVASTPGGAILGFGYNVVENVIGNTAALFSRNNLNPISGEILSPGTIQRTKEDLVINAGTVGIGGPEVAVQGGRAMVRSGIETFGPTIDAAANSYFARNGMVRNAVPESAVGALRPPVPRVNVADDFTFKANKSGSFTLQYGDPEGVHGLIVNVDRQGVLGFDIRSAPGGTSFSNASGTDMFASAMQRLDLEGVQVRAIRGVWIDGTDSVNAAQYLSALNRGMTPQQAAANTWTGGIAARYGYTNVGVPNTGYSTTTVIFGR